MFKMSQVILENANNWHLSGELSFTTVGGLLTELTSKITDSKELIIDLGKVTYTDSAGLALLIELLRSNTSITFCNIPTRILNLSAVAGVKDLLTNKGF
jgi:phospholipid transport system transporter-binding protein